MRNEDERVTGAEIELRHLKVFDRVMSEGSFRAAALDSGTTRANVARLMERLERSFENPLFAGERGKEVPTPFAERLHHDLRFLRQARQRLAKHVRGIHEGGRLLRVGASAGMFRSQAFRRIFRGLHGTPAVRAVLTTLDPSEAVRTMASGRCDLIVGCYQSALERFVTVPIGMVPYHPLVRRGWSRNTETLVVALDGCPPPCDGRRDWRVIDEERWLHFLDYPEECSPGTRLLGPEVMVGAEGWERGPGEAEFAVQLVAAAPRQHPYEFLDSLLRRLQQDISKS